MPSLYRPRTSQCSPDKSPVSIDDHGQFRQHAEIGGDDGQKYRIGLHGRGRQEYEYGHNTHAHARNHGIADDVGPSYPQQQA